MRKKRHNYTPEEKVFKERDRKLEEARNLRKQKRRHFYPIFDILAGCSQRSQL